MWRCRVGLCLGWKEEVALAIFRVSWPSSAPVSRCRGFREFVRRFGWVLEASPITTRAFDQSSAGEADYMLHNGLTSLSIRPTRIPSPVRGKMSNECGNEVMRSLECQCQSLSKLAPMGKVRRGNAHRSARAGGVRSVMAGAANDRVIHRAEGIPILSYSRESCVLLWWAAAIRPTAACHGPRQNGNFGQSWIPAGGFGSDPMSCARALRHLLDSCAKTRRRHLSGV
ncbi:hypothetical protein L1887_50648 [Cichorium endivia]|nr:hypothetical protein L1887_50648 [Cichorium endivia]